MKRIATILALLAATAGASTFARRPIVITIHAQTLPVSRTLVWDATPDPCVAPDLPCPVSNYTVTVDGAVVGNPTTPSQALTFTTAGRHPITLTATNTWGVSPAATLSVNIKVPNAPSNPRIQ